VTLNRRARTLLGAEIARLPLLASEPEAASLMGMWSGTRAFAQLLRALIACAVLVFAVEAPALHDAAWSARDPSSWVAPRRALAPPARSARAVVAARADRPVPTALRVVPRERALLPIQALQRLDGRYLYLELQSLLC